jgi:hypothetical protein
MKVIFKFLLLLPLAAQAQYEKEIFHFRYGVAPLTAGNNHKDAVQTVDLAVRFPLRVNEKNVIAAGIGYETVFTEPHEQFGASVHGLSVQGMFQCSLDERRALMLVGTAGIYSDFKDISGEDLRYTVGMRYKTKVRDNFMLAYGLAVSRQFFGVMVAPFIDFDWSISDRVKVSGPFPLNTRLRYRVSSNTEFLLFLKPENSTYRLSARENDSRYLQRKQWNAGLGFDHMLTKHWQLSARGGYSVRRTFEIYNNSETGVLSILTFDLRGGKRTPEETYEQKAWFAELSIAWVITKD